jgi:hypothetical protein
MKLESIGRKTQAFFVYGRQFIRSIDLLENIKYVYATFVILPCAFDTQLLPITNHIITLPAVYTIENLNIPSEA